MAVVPFPRTRNRTYILRQAERMAEISPSAAQNHLAHQLRVQREAMERRGIASNLIQAEVAEIEVAIRCAFGRLVTKGETA